MKESFSINNEITSLKIKLINEDGKFEGIFNKKDALDRAFNLSLDLVEFDIDKQGFSVCKIMDYGKLKYSLLKKKKALKQTNNVIKEMKFNFNIADHDLEIKHKKIFEFIDKKYKVNYILELKGREKNLVDVAIDKIKKGLSCFENKASFDEPKTSYSNNRIRISSTINPK